MRRINKFAFGKFSNVIRGLFAVLILAAPAAWPVSAGEHIFRMSASHIPGTSQPDGNGYVDLFAMEAFRRAGIEFEIVYLPGKRAKAMLNAGEVDGYLTGTPALTASAPNAIMVPEPFLTYDFVALSRDAATRISGWDELSQYPVAYVRGHKYLNRHVKNTGNRLVLLNDYNHLRKFFLQRSLDHGGVKFVLMAREIAVSTFGDDLGRTVFFVEPPLGSVSGHFFVHERHRGLVPRLDAAVRELHQDGTADRLRKKAKALEAQ